MVLLPANLTIILGSQQEKVVAAAWQRRRYGLMLELWSSIRKDVFWVLQGVIVRAASQSGLSQGGTLRVPPCHA